MSARVVRVLVVLVCSLHVLDGITTQQFLAAGGIEANQIIRTLLERYGAGAMYAYKLLGVILFVWYLHAVHTVRDRILFLRLMAWAYVAIVTYNVMYVYHLNGYLS